MLLLRAIKPFSFLNISLFFSLVLIILLPSSSSAKNGANPAVDACFVQANDIVTSSPNETALQAAVDAASPGDIIKVAGTCAGIHDALGGRKVTLYIGQSVTIRGGYSVDNWNVSDPKLNPTTLSALPGGQVIFAGVDKNITLEGLIITGGDANNGGGIENRATLSLLNSVVSGNSASGNGGGVLNSTGALNILNSTIHNNTAGSQGGGIYSASTLNITNSTVSGNKANDAAMGGGGMAVAGSSTLVEYSTIAGNEAPFAAGFDGLWLSAGTLTIKNSILGSNGTENCHVSEGTFSSGGYNLSSDASCALNQASDLNSVSPLLGALTDNGGPTKTHFLLPFSPAIDSIPHDESGCGITIVEDQRGVTRPVEGACDRGAVELEVNYAPGGTADTYSLLEDGFLDTPPPGVLSNDLDGDGDASLTAILNTAPTSGLMTLNDDGSFEYIPSLNFCGPDTFTYFANDGNLSSPSTTATLNVTCVNDVPVVNAGPDRVVDEGTLILLFGSFFDPETNVNLQTFWDFGDGSNTTGTLQPTHTYIDEGTFLVKLSVTDDEGAIDDDTTIVTVENVPAIVENPGDKTILVGGAVSFSVNYQDPGILDTHTATINWRDGTVESATVNPATKKISGSHTYILPGTFNAMLTVTDSGGATSVISFKVTVSIDNRDGFLVYLPFVNK